MTVWVNHVLDESGAQSAIKMAVPGIATRYELAGLEDELSRAMGLAAGAYWHWWGKDRHEQGRGAKRATVALEGALREAVSALSDHRVRDRIRLALPSMRPEVPPSLPQNEIFSLPGAAENISRLLKIVEHACKLDGRALNGSPRGDIRAAAKPLRDFWVSIAGRKDKLYLSDDKYQDEIHYPETVEFLFDCLSVIDKKVKRRMLVDLDK